MRATRTPAIFGCIACAVFGQKLEMQSADTRKIVQVETAKEHLTVIELAGPVTMVAVGNQNAFSVERRENKVFVKPVEDDARTNLFVWTAAGRFVYELLPAGSIAAAHFAIDQPQVTVQAPAPKEAEEPGGLPREMLLDAQPVLLSGTLERAGRVEVILRDLYRKNGRLYMRYAIQNHSGRTYLPAHPAVFAAVGVRSDTSIIPHAGRQLGDQWARSLKVEKFEPLDTISEEQVAPLGPGEQAMGWLAVKTPGSAHKVLKFVFAADAKGPVDALLVLDRVSDRREVARAGEAGR